MQQSASEAELGKWYDWIYSRRDRMTPNIGDIVYYVYPAAEHRPNESEISAAVVVRVWSGTLLNLRVISDNVANGAEWRTSVQARDTGNNADGYWYPREEDKR